MPSYCRKWKKRRSSVCAYAQSLPQLAIDKTNVNWLGADLAEVTVTISNVGYLPTYLSREAKLLGTTRPVKVSLQGH